MSWTTISRTRRSFTTKFKDELCREVIDFSKPMCWDNSMAESSFAAIKNECVYRTVYATKYRARPPNTE